MSAEWGTPPFRDLQYCLRCCMPASNEGVSFDEFGVCRACQSSEQKMRIDWTLREKALRNILDKHRSQDGSNYDCIVPISGGKDSTFQLHVITQVYGLRPLAVTFSHNWYSKTGRENLENALENFGVDHILFTPNRALVNKLARQSLFNIGDSCWHCHAGVGAFPLQVAVRWNVPLMIWGESIAETSGRATYLEPVRKFDREYFLNVSAKVDVDKMVSENVDARRAAPVRAAQRGGAASASACSASTSATTSSGTTSARWSSSPTRTAGRAAASRAPTRATRASSAGWPACTTTRSTSSAASAAPPTTRRRTCAPA